MYSKHPKIVNLNTNPCKMCMPMGSVSAFYGIAGCMSILHGSQGCSTYIRRHMATHYNEPVDIASSSLTEEGTVFGGEKNLIKGLDNLIKLYRPEVIGISTTCLAETIGEDVPAIVQRYLESRPDSKVKILTVNSAGYSGTQYEGWFRALHAVVEQTEMETSRHNGINVITGPISPADARALKAFLKCTGLSCTLLPDISDNLDGQHGKDYSRLPSGGTSIREIMRMGGARATIELATFAPEGASPGLLLRDNYAVPLIRLNMPVGLRDTDAFFRALENLGGTIPTEMAAERGRFLDAMIDAHKYNALGRAAIFGEPDTVFGLTRLCCENGLVPVVAATGSNCPALVPMLEEEIRPVADNVLAGKFDVLNFADFDAIERAALANNANLLIGNSDGRRMAGKHGLPLVRCAFPVHDYVGGQRIRLLGYSGALQLLDSFANALISQQNSHFRANMYERYFPEKTAQTQEAPLHKTNAEKSGTHPCFSASARHTSGRIHLPVAPECNIQCNYCVRDFDCPNESRPGVTTRILTPQEALERFVRMKKEMPNLTVAGIAGPGDALANFAETAQTLRLIREADPAVTFCLSTNGLLLPLYARQLTELGVSHVTVTVNAVNPVVGAQIYRHVNYLGTLYKGEAGAAVLMSNQLAGLKMLAESGVISKVNIVLIKGINDTHVEEVVLKVKSLGAAIVNIMQMIPVKGSAFENFPLVSNREHMRLRKRCEVHMPQMHHCSQCRADAVGLLGDDQSIHLRELEEPVVSTPVQPDAPSAQIQPVRIAVASRSGVVVDQHFGFADQFYIYESDGVSTRLVEARRTGSSKASCGMCGGGRGKREDTAEGVGKIAKALTAVADCKAVVVMRIGESPSRQLAEKGIAVFSTYDSIDKAVRQAVSKCTA